MVTKNKDMRVIPIMRIKGVGDYDHSHLMNSKVFSDAVYMETIHSIKEAIKTNSKTATLFRIDDTEDTIIVDKSQFSQALDSCIEHYIELEDYETCQFIVDIKDKL